MVWPITNLNNLIWSAMTCAGSSKFGFENHDLGCHLVVTLVAGQCPPKLAQQKHFCLRERWLQPRYTFWDVWGVSLQSSDPSKTAMIHWTFLGMHCVSLKSCIETTKNCRTTSPKCFAFGWQIHVWTSPCHVFCFLFLAVSKRIGCRSEAYTASVLWCWLDNHGDTG